MLTKIITSIMCAMGMLCVMAGLSSADSSNLLAPIPMILVGMALIRPYYIREIK